ncbi:MAG: catechol 1,2-dioxygenase [Gammaproteobacteria bacterium]|nr:catechol 1,2-dioxygenase [Gammaproteobacteria bacterium]
MAFVNKDNLTQLAKARWETSHSPRMREVMTKLVEHAHAFVRDVNPTEAEWLAACEFLARTGREFCDDRRNEFILLSDVLGISTLVVQLNDKKADGTTPNTVLGPFYQPGSPEMADGQNMAEGIEGETCYVHGNVTDLNGTPVPNARLDVWQADDEGMYEVQLPEITDPRLRAVFHTGSDGKYCVQTISPLGYTIPMDGTVGDLIRGTEISHFRPAHIHFIVEAPGYKRVVTHLFRKDAPYLDSDVVFGVKDDLIVPFNVHDGGESPTGDKVNGPFATVQFDIRLEAV